MKTADALCSRILILLSSLAIVFLLSPSSLHAQSIIDDWQNVRTPPVPELKSVTVDPKATALLLLDFNKQTCNPERRPRCVSSIPNVERLLKAARGKKAKVVYSLSAGATTADIAKELAPLGNEPVVTSGPDKFLGTDLEKILKERGVKTVIAVGTAAHGAVLYTVSAASLRGFQVIVAVDGISAESMYAEQATAWILANAPRISSMVTLTKTDLIKWEQ